ncbi:uncharacterized protein BP5553_07059 [Venustampulla echinocandica]|uniref:Uncharacterized protein n=1 Tax=Venustampulla echinocandica TaxID=2656787 RepID=A0A370TIE2_9HELO|nr:uncharacterized protein BP5553_07059 [Venustampulla echinocandica]RDL35128.1 hypothetical protein BP5553_07059 [Venustampulla echinocandica]
MINIRPLRQTAAFLLLLLLLPIASCKDKDKGEVLLDEYRSNTGPLTTTFTADSTCLSEIRTKYPWPGAYPELEVGCEGPGGNECCPDRWGKNRYYSPGVCPAGYIACTLPTTRQRDETTNLCCPSNFDCPTQVSYDICRSSLNTWRTAEYTDRNGATSIAKFMAVSATAIQIRFRQTDSSVVPIPTDSLKLPPPKTEAEKKAEAGLSSGARAGIGVGVSVGVIALLVVVVLYIRRGAARRREESRQQGAMLLGTVPGEQDEESEAPPPYSKK